MEGATAIGTTLEPHDVLLAMQMVSPVNSLLSEWSVDCSIAESMWSLLVNTELSRAKELSAVVLAIIHLMATCTASSTVLTLLWRLKR